MENDCVSESLRIKALTEEPTCFGFGITKKFFDSIDHNILFELIKKKISDEDTLLLIDKILKSFEKLPNVGLPLGNVTSQLFANIYLNELDQFVKHKFKVKSYFRYADDFIILSDNESELLNLLRDIKVFLKDYRTLIKKKSS